MTEQSRPQSPRYPCPAERENEDLWEDPFELGISLAIDKACAVPPEVHKQSINNNLLILTARGGCASSGYDRFEHEHGVQNSLRFDIQINNTSVDAVISASSAIVMISLELI